MIALELRFLTGKYHATPWGRQVNEGAVEWPPSPWRVLRALIATWYYKFPEVSETQMRELIDALSSAPSYKLPDSHDGHTRHYMPAAGDAKTKIFDTFLSINPCEPLIISWPQAELNLEQVELLKQLSQSINYFGRAESWVEAKVVDVAKDSCNTSPINDGEVGEDQELVRLLGLADSDSFLRWRESTCQALTNQKLKEEQDKAIARGKPIDKIKLPPKTVAAIESSLPLSTFDALQCDTSELRKAGWNRPPASQWLGYVRPLKKPSTKTRRFKHNAALPTVARYAVAGTVLPRLTDAILLGDRLRKYLMGISGKRNHGQCSKVFSGKTEDGKPLAELAMQHGHAHFFSESYASDNRGKLLTCWFMLQPASMQKTSQFSLHFAVFTEATGMTCN